MSAHAAFWAAIRQMQGAHSPLTVLQIRRVFQHGAAQNDSDIIMILRKKPHMLSVPRASASECVTPPSLRLDSPSILFRKV